MTEIPEVGPYKGIIVLHAQKCYAQIPAAYRGWVELDDVISEGLVHYCHVAKKFNPKKGARFSTWIYLVIQNFYRSYVQRFKVAMRSAPMVAIDDADEIIQLEAPPDILAEDIQQAEGRLAQILEMASEALFDYLRRCVFGSESEPFTDGLLVEMRRICKFVGATVDDFLLLLPVVSIA